MGIRHLFYLVKFHLTKTWKYENMFSLALSVLFLQLTAGYILEEKDVDLITRQGRRTVELGIFTDVLLWNEMQARVGNNPRLVEKRMRTMVKNLVQKANPLFSEVGIRLRIKRTIVFKPQDSHKYAFTRFKLDYNKIKLNDFKAYARSVNRNNQYDLMALLTAGGNGGGIAGVSPVGAICTSEATLVSEVMLDRRGQLHGAGSSVPVLAHEIGHSLGAMHDGKFYWWVADNRSCRNSNNIMWPTVKTNTRGWSSCSRRSMNELRPPPTCLYN